MGLWKQSSDYTWVSGDSQESVAGSLEVSATCSLDDLADFRGGPHSSRVS